MADYSGFGALGAALAGQSDGRAFQDQLFRNYRTQGAAYDVERAREQAGQERLMRIAREGLGARVLGAYGQNPQGELVAAILSANNSPSLTQAGPLADLALPGAMQLRTDAVDAVRAGNYPEYNALNAALQGKSFEPVRDLGDVLVGSGAPLGAEMVVTPVAQQQIATGKANEAAAYALRDQRQRPPAGRAAGTANYTTPSQSVLDGALTFTNENGKVVPDYADQEDFRIWQANKVGEDPRYADGDFALGQYLATRTQREQEARQAKDARAQQRALAKGQPVMVDPANLGDALVGPSMAPVASDPASALIAEANDAIARGANPALVEQRLKERMAALGLDPRN